MEISTHAKIAAKECLEYDLMGIIIAHNRDALKGELPFESDIQSAIEAATAEKDQRINALTSKLESISTELVIMAGFIRKMNYVEAFERHLQKLREESETKEKA